MKIFFKVDFSKKKKDQITKNDYPDTALKNRKIELSVLIQI